MLDDMDKFMKTQGGWQRPSLPPPETNVGIQLYLLSDLSTRHFNSQIIRLRPVYRQPPGDPRANRETRRRLWTAKEIGDAIDKGLVASLQCRLLGLRRKVSQARDAGR